jgi:hypothetical protein
MLTSDTKLVHIVPYLPYESNKNYETCENSFDMFRKMKFENRKTYKARKEKLFKVTEICENKIIP